MVLVIVMLNVLAEDHILKEVNMDLAAVRWIFGRLTVSPKL
jgi:hypothetical protein